MSRKKLNILSLDGGGIRGIAVLRILEEIEKATGKRLHELFQIRIGTSTGGLIALLSSVLQKNGNVMTAQEAKSFYYKQGPNIFPKPPVSMSSLSIIFLLATTIFLTLFLIFRNQDQYSETDLGGYISALVEDKLAVFIVILICFLLMIPSLIMLLWKIGMKYFKPEYSRKGLIQAMSQIFSKNTTLKNAYNCCCVVATDVQYKRPIVFNSLRAHLAYDYRHHASIFDLAAATSAAPTYFPPVTLNNPNPDNNRRQKESVSCFDLSPPEYKRDKLLLEDGGTTCNNPAALSLEIAETYLQDKTFSSTDVQLFSIGTGTLSGIQDDPSQDPFKSDAWCGMQRPDGGLDNTCYRLLFNDPFGVALEAYKVHKEVEKDARLRQPGSKYTRVQFKVTKSQLKNMDDCSEENMKNLIEAAEAYIFASPQVYSLNFCALIAALTDNAGQQPFQEGPSPKYMQNFELKVFHRDQPELQRPLMGDS